MKRKFMTFSNPLLIFLSFLFISPMLSAQRQCASNIDLQKMRLAEPERYRRFMELEAFTERYLQTMKEAGSEGERLIDPNTSVIIIPVVVHVIWNTAAQNISDAQVQSQIAVLNEDFRRLNADRVNTPAAFTGVASDFQIEFRLACVDPNGAATNGITRTQTTRTVFTLVRNSNGTINETSTRIKFTSQGGRDAWPTNRYLNMWVANLGNGLLGYAQFPADYASKPNTDGVVCRTTSFGRVGNVTAPFQLGRTATHEVGHWLNLRHIWGDANCGNDQVGDTPTQQTSNTGCPAFPRITCGNGPNGDMHMNYMDYTNDACMNIFTAGQRARARAVFTAGGPRAAFIDNYFRINPPGFPCNPTTIAINSPLCLNPITWTVTAPLSITGGQGTNQITVSNTGGGSYATVTASANGYTDSRQITLGTPVSTPSVFLDQLGGSCFFTVKAQISAADYADGTVEFSNDGGNSWYEGSKIGSNTVASFEEVLGPALYNIQCRIRNSCGEGPIAFESLLIPNPPPGCFFRTAPVKEEEEQNDVPALKVYPNPAGEQLTISLPVFGKGMNLRIVDLSGRVVKLAVLANSITQLDISALKSGVYFIQISGADGKQFKSRFIKL